MTSAHLAIDVDGVQRSFGDVRALDGVTVQVGSGEVVGLLGHNGAGKTTMVRLLTGILLPDAGAVQILGRDPHEDGPAVRRAIGVVSAVPAVDDRLTGWQNLEFATEVFGVDRAHGRRRGRALLEQFGLAERADEGVAGYSTGMRQRLALVRALLPDPPVLLLDEPTAALDPVASRDVRALVEHLARDEARSVLLCSHNLVEVQQVCDRVVVLEHGRVIADGAPAELAARLRIGRLRLEVEPADLVRAEQVLAATGAPAETGSGGRLTVTSLAGVDVPGLIAELVGADVRIHQAAREDGSLEDVYFALHDRTAP